MDLDRASSSATSAEADDPRPAVGGWHADECRDHYEYCLRSEIEHFASLYGKDALIAELSKIGDECGFNVESAS